MGRVSILDFRDSVAEISAAAVGGDSVVADDGTIPRALGACKANFRDAVAEIFSPICG